MIKKSFLFIGLGGAGQRHLRTIKKILKNNCNLFCYRAKHTTPFLDNKFCVQKKNLNSHYKLHQFNKFNNIFNFKYKFAFVSNPTSLHYESSIKLLKKKISVISEKPFVCSNKEFKDLKKTVFKKKIKFYVAYQRNFHSLVKKLYEIIRKKNLSFKRIKVEVSSYVPEWHKYENYKSLYAVKKKLGGGVLLTESHEIDIILRILGLPLGVYCKKFFKKKFLDIETAANLKMFYENCSVDFNLNMFDKKKRSRKIKFFFLNGHLLLDLVNNTLIYKDGHINKKYSCGGNENNLQFLRQMNFIINMKQSDVTYNLLFAEKNNKVLNSFNKSSRLNKKIKLK